MKLNESMRYPHPVLSDFSSDYVTGEFKCSFVQQMTAEGELKLTAELNLDSTDLRKLIEDQQAATGYFVVCRRTYFNVLQSAPLGRSERHFDGSKLFGAVTLRPAVWTLTPVQHFSSPLIHKEFGTSVNLPKGAVIALGPEFRFSIDKKKFKPFESIFELAIGEGIEPGMVQVDPLRDRITILAEPKTHKDLADMRNMPAGRSILLSSVYLPAVMDVLALLQSGDTAATGMNWYRVFKAKCDDLGINPADPNGSPLMIAQKLLRAPLRKSIAVVGTM
jgi:hypothetical protein